MQASGSRLVVCGRPPLDPPAPSIAVHYDNEGGGLNATDHLLGLGHRRILYVGGWPGITTQRDRLAGYRLAYARRGLPVDPELVIEGRFDRHFGYERTAGALRELTGAKAFTAVFAANDATAAGALQALREAGRRVPEDVSVVGYDDVPVAAETVPALTTVHIPLQEMGRSAVRLALGTEEGDRGGWSPEKGTLLLGTHLVLRGTTGPAPL
jgi:LacI family transcriptional regulator